MITKSFSLLYIAPLDEATFLTELDRGLTSGSGHRFDNRVTITYVADASKIDMHAEECIILLSRNHPDSTAVITQYADKMPVILLYDYLNHASLDMFINAGAINCLPTISLTAQWLYDAVLMATTMFENRQRRLLGKPITTTNLSDKDNLRSVAHLSELFQITDTDLLMHHILQNSMSIIDGSLGNIFLHNHELDTFICSYAYPEHSTPLGIEIPQESITGMISKSGDIYITTDIDNDPNMYTEHRHTIPPHMVTLISVPLRTADTIVGVMHLSSPVKDRQLTTEERESLTTLAAIAGGTLHHVLTIRNLESRFKRRSDVLADKNSQLAQVNQKLQELDQLKSKFVSDISHELRTPITALGLHLDLLRFGHPSKRESYLNTIKLEVNRLKAIVTDVLKLSRFDLKRVVLNITEIDLNQLTETEIKSRQGSDPDLKVAMNFEPSDSLPLIYGDIDRLKEAISYLLDNAIKFTVSGTVTIRSTYDSNHDMVHLIIQDSGTGIAGSEINKVFDRFYRGKNAQSIIGTGLGLTIVREIVNLHGGQIWVRSKLNEGSVFTMRLPRKHDFEQSDSPVIYQ